MIVSYRGSGSLKEKEPALCEFSEAARQARVRARQLMGFFGLCWRKPRTRSDRSPGPASPISCPSDSEPAVCLPKMPLPKVRKRGELDRQKKVELGFANRLEWNWRICTYSKRDIS